MYEGLLTESGRKPRFSELNKFLPVFFVLFIIGSLGFIYAIYHLPNLVEGKTEEDKVRGGVETLTFVILTFMVCLCYVLSVVVEPGSIPDTPEWAYTVESDEALDSKLHSMQEVKRTGERRHCKWCGKYKPDRTHHCRMTQACILKMDHYCPWIYNCVGFYNHKFFFLLLFYSVLDTNFIAFTMYESVARVAANPDTPFSEMFFVLFGETLAVFMAFAVSCFFFFHVWLMINALTTIEFCEKQSRKSGGYLSVYDQGFYGNICAVLGPNPILWLLPVSRPTGEGLYFVTEYSRLTSDIDPEKSRLKFKQRNPMNSSEGGGKNMSSFVDNKQVPGQTVGARSPKV